MLERTGKRVALRGRFCFFVVNRAGDENMVVAHPPLRERAC